MNGFTVCMVHGAGTRRRVKSGERKSPATAALKHGIYAKAMDKYPRVLAAIEGLRTKDVDDRQHEMLAAYEAALFELQHLPAPTPDILCHACGAWCRCRTCAETTTIEKVLRHMERAVRLVTEYRKSQKLKADEQQVKLVAQFLRQFMQAADPILSPQQLEDLSRALAQMPIVSAVLD